MVAGCLLMLAAAKADPSYQGHIVNTASMAGWLAAPLMGVYNVSKHAVVALSVTLYHDLRLAQRGERDLVARLHRCCQRLLHLLFHAHRMPLSRWFSR